MSALTHISIIHDTALSDHGWMLNDIGIASDLLDWCVLRLGTTSQGVWGYKQYSIGGYWVYEFQFLKASYKMMFDLQFSEVVTIYHSVEQFYETNKFMPPGATI